MSKLLTIAAVTIATLASACGPSSLRVAPVKIEPIHLVIDVNLRDAGADPKPAEPADPQGK